MQPANAAFPGDPEPTPEHLLTHTRRRIFLKRLLTPLNGVMAFLLALSLGLLMATWIRKLDTWPPPILARAFFLDLAQMFIPLASSFFYCAKVTSFSAGLQSYNFY